MTHFVIFTLGVVLGVVLGRGRQKEWKEMLKVVDDFCQEEKPE